MNKNLKDNDIIRYLELVDRKLSIETSGINWKPEYESELEYINSEITCLRAIIDAEHAKRDNLAYTEEKGSCIIC